MSLHSGRNHFIKTAMEPVNTTIIKLGSKKCIHYPCPNGTAFFSLTATADFSSQIRGAENATTENVSTCLSACKYFLWK